MSHHGCSVVIALCCRLVVPSQLFAQDSLAEYAVKFACGLQPAASSPATAWEAVAPGRYYTAINIRNASSDTARIRTRLATTRSAPTPGMLISLTEPLQPLVIPPHLALEVDCREILAAFHAPVTQATGFLKGFVVLLSDRDLDVVVVYSAGPGPGVATMDVERVLARRSDRAAGCPDLLIFTMSDPVVTAALHTRIRVTVRNAGSVGASNVELQLEDQSRTTADRIVTTTIPYIAGNDQIDVILELPYELTPARRSSVLVTVDPKELIAECDESNNQRRLSPA